MPPLSPWIGMSDESFVGPLAKFWGGPTNKASLLPDLASLNTLVLRLGGFGCAYDLWPKDNRKIALRID
jgi:hypothetical protein